MNYQGGKSRLAKHFAKFLQEELRARGGTFVEPFVGGFNLVPHLGDAVQVALCNDAHPGLIRMYQALQAGEFDPPEVLTKDEFDELKRLSDWTNPLSAFAAFGCTYMGKEWATYARNKRGDDSTGHARASRNSLLKKAPSMAKVTFVCGDYRRLRAGPEDVVYADPPYIGTTGYSVGEFDHPVFYDWCEEQVQRGAAVFVSEYTVPSYWEIVWQKERTMTTNGSVKEKENGVIKRIEILARVKTRFPGGSP